MYHNKDRRRKYRSHSKPFRRRNNGSSLRNEGPNGILNGQIRSNSFRGNLNAQKLIEKYNNLAKEALSVGDKILSENYLQHADHFSRIVLSSNVQQNKTNNLNDEKDLNLKKETATNGENDNIQQEKDLNKTSE